MIALGLRNVISDLTRNTNGRKCAFHPPVRCRNGDAPVCLIFDHYYGEQSMRTRAQITRSHSQKRTGSRRMVRAFSPLQPRFRARARAREIACCSASLAA